MTPTPPAVEIPPRLKDLLDGPAFAHLTTLDADGFPQASAMWIMRDGDRIVFNTAKGRRKYFNMQRDPRVAVSVSATNEYTNFSIQGRVIEMRESDGRQVIDELSRKYRGEDYTGMKPGMVRVTVIVEPTRIATHG